MATIKVAVIVGSLRKQSINRRLAHAVEKLLPAEFAFDYVDIGPLPPYNQDFDDDYPASAVAFKQRVEAAHALLFVTPEYNRSVPGVLKNAIDIGTRPGGSNVWSGKPGAVIGTSPGAHGTISAQLQLRPILSRLNVAVLPEPEIALQFKEEAFDADNQIVDERTRKFLQGFVDRYVAWTRKQLGH